MNVLVTGGAGYIGGVVADLLVRAGHRVLVYDDLSTGHRRSVPRDAAFVHGDLLDGVRVRGALAEARAEAVVHLAASSLVGESVVDPRRYYRNNVEAGRVLLEAMRAVGTSVIVFSSSAAVYGAPEAQPIDEDAPTVPTSPYGATKLAFEQELADAGREWGLRSVCLRYFNAAGATETHGEDHHPETHLIPRVLQAAAGRIPEILVFGTDWPTPDGTCVRDYVHVADIARAHLLALARPPGVGRCTAYNVGCGDDGDSVLQVVEAARRVTGRSIAIRPAPRRAGDPPRLVAGCARIREELGWQPEHDDLEEIVASAWRWMESRASADVHRGER